MKNSTSVLRLFTSILFALGLVFAESGLAEDVRKKNKKAEAEAAKEKKAKKKKKAPIDPRLAEKKKQNKDFFKRDERQKNGKVTSSVDAPVMDAEPTSDDVTTKERIKPKSIHIKGTSELKSLFQTFK